MTGEHLGPAKAQSDGPELRVGETILDIRLGELADLVFPAQRHVGRNQTALYGIEEPPYGLELSRDVAVNVHAQLPASRLHRRLSYHESRGWAYLLPMAAYIKWVQLDRSRRRLA